jgi:hypothetical protein
VYRSIGRFGAAALLALVSLSSTVTVTSAATPHTWYVDDDGTASTSSCTGSKSVPTSIQAAIDGATAGDEIRVCSGTYQERLNIHKKILISAVTPYTATIRAPWENIAYGSTLIDIHDSPGQVVIAGLNIVIPTASPCANYGDAVRVTRSPGASLQRVHIGISGNESQCGYENGIDVVSGFGAYMLRNTITDFDGTGIIMNGKQQVIELNTIKFLHANLGPDSYENAHGIDVVPVLGETPTIVTRNVVKAATTADSTTPSLATGIYVSSGPALVTGNTISYADKAIQLFNTAGGSTYRNTATTGITSWGLLVQASSTYDIGNNRFAAGYAGIAVTSGSSGNSIHDNDAHGPSSPDCTDVTAGSGTAGTADTWTNNIGTSVPKGLCTP